MNKLATHSMFLNIDLNKSYCRCGKCGQTAEVDTSVVLTSNPPKYNYHCPHCGSYGYTFCSDIFCDTKGAQFEPTPVEVESLASSCLICGELVPVSLFDNSPKVCEKCKKAVLKVRKMLEEKE